MPPNLFKVEKGISIDDIQIIYGKINPASVGYNADIGSIYIHIVSSATSETYQKTGSGDTDWTLFSTSPNISLVSEVKHNINISFVKEVETYSHNKLVKMEYKNSLDDNIYVKTFSYVNHKLDSWTLTRVSDNTQLKCVFIYSGGKIIRKEYL